MIASQGMCWATRTLTAKRMGMGMAIVMVMVTRQVFCFGGEDENTIGGGFYEDMTRLTGGGYYFVPLPHRAKQFKKAIDRLCATHCTTSIAITISIAIMLST